MKTTFPIHTEIFPAKAMPASAQPSEMRAKDDYQLFPLQDLSEKEAPQKKEAKPDQSEQMKSFCKVQGHGAHEIVFACYECRDTFCSHCIESH